MSSRAHILAGAADALSVQCVFYVAAATMVAAGRGWSLRLSWPLLCCVLCCAIFEALLKKPRSTAVLAVAAGAAFAASLTVYVLASEAPVPVFCWFVLAVYAGLTAGIPLYQVLNRPTVQRHLTTLDVLLLAFLWLLLAQSGVQGGAGGRMLIAAVLLLDAGAAVGLRMAEGGGQENSDTLRAGLVALGAAGAVALFIMALTGLFSKSGAVTAEVLRAVGSAFVWLGAVLTRFFTWLVSLIPLREEDAFVLPQDGLPALNAIPEEDTASVALDGVWIAAALAALILAAAVYLVLRFRRVRLTASALGGSAVAPPSVSRLSGSLKKRWLAMLAALRFGVDALRYRNTPAGLLVWLERRWKRKKCPRLAGESMRAFVTRVDKTGELAPLADALDRQFYAAAGVCLSPAACRALRRSAAGDHKQTMPRAVSQTYIRKET